MTGTDGERRRVVTWSDPTISGDVMRTMSGLEFLRAIGEGHLPRPPMLELLGIVPEEVEEGRVAFAVEPAEYHYNPIGVVHGGLACTLADSAMGCAVHSTLPVGVGYTTVELKINLVRPITQETGRITCEGRVIHVGGRIATAEASVVDAAGKLYAHATTTCMLFRD
jgi:uncharacterized protein (TIGR00369 family)